MTRTFQNITREELILRRVFEDTKVQNKVIQHLKPDLFDEIPNQVICKAIIEGYDKYKAFPQAQELIPVLQTNSEERNKLLKIMNHKIDSIDSQMTVDVIESFFKEKKTEKVLVDCAEAINQRDFKNIASMVTDLEDSVNFSLHMDVGLDLVKDTTEALRLLNETHRAIPSSLLDVRTKTSGDLSSGGWYRAALSVFQGMPNVGKTILLCNEAAYAYQAGYNVLYITLELGKEHIWERIAANITDIPLYKIRKESEDDIEKLLRENKEHNAPKCGNLLVKEMPTTATPLDVEILINEIKVSEGYDVDIVVIDYLQKMKPNKGSTFSRSQSLYTLGMEVSEQIRDVARKLEIAALTASQVNRDGYDNTQGSMKNTAGSAGVNDTADLMITIMQDPYLRQYNLFLHAIIKNRFGPKDDVFLSECAYQYMRVRSANGEQVRQYSDHQLNQNANIPNFNNVNTPTPISLPEPEKTEEQIKEEKHQNELSRFREINDKLNKTEEPEEKKSMLDSTSESDTYSARMSWDERKKRNNDGV